MSELRQFFVLTDQSSLETGATVTLSERDSHHVKNVLRLTPGTLLRLVFPEQATVCLAELSGYDKKGALFHIQESSPVVSPLPPVFTLLVGLCKAKKNDFIIEKATELGVQQIHLIHTRNSEFKFHGESDAEKKLERWKVVAEGAANQSKRFTLPALAIFNSLEHALQALPPKEERPRFCCSLEKEAGRPLSFSPLDQSTILAVGPEGDFSTAEYQCLEASGFLPLSLGQGVLRSETAVIAGIATIRAISNL